MSKVAKLVYFSLMTRVVVDENATEDDIIKASYPNIQAKIDNRELGDNLEEIDDDLECPFGTFDTDDPRVTVVLLSTVDQKYVVTGKGIPTQIKEFQHYSDWDSIEGMDGEAVLDCQIDFDDSVKLKNENEYYQFQTVNLVKDNEGNISMGYDYDNADELIVSHKPLAEAIIEFKDKLKM